MALGATIRKLELSIADIDRHYYETHSLVLAQHPSESDERLMLRVFAFAIFADPALEFGRGLSTEDEPDLWLRDLTGNIEYWIDLGMPDEKRIRKACGRAARVEVITYGGSKASVWHERQAADLIRFDNLRVWNVAQQDSRLLAAMAGRAMRIDVSIQDGQVLISNDVSSVQVEPRMYKR